MPQSLYDLEGEHLLSGVEVLSSEGYGYGVVFTLDGVSYEVLEDPDDGYRSHCGELTVAEQPPKFSFPPQPVLCAMRHNDPMVEQHDDILDFYNPETNQRILSLGTANYDDWYPTLIWSITLSIFPATNARFPRPSSVPFYRRRVSYVEVLMGARRAP